MSWVFESEEVAGNLMSESPLEIRLETPRGEVIDGIDSLREEVDAELRATAEKESVNLTGPEEIGPPVGAQGADELVKWFLENPDSVAALLNLLITLREMIRHYRSGGDNQGTTTINVNINGRSVDLAQEDVDVRKEIEASAEKRSEVDE